MEAVPTGLKLMPVSEVKYDATRVAFVGEVRGLGLNNDWIADAFGGDEAGFFGG